MQPWYFHPVLFKIGSLAVHWYGLMYALAFVAGYFWIYFSASGKRLLLSDSEKDTFLLVSMIFNSTAIDAFDISADAIF